MPSTLVILLTLAAVARLTRLVTSDLITEPLRDRIIRFLGTGSKAAYLLSCAWCASVWIAVPVAWLAVLSDGSAWFVIPALALSASLAAGIVAENTE